MCAPPPQPACGGGLYAGPPPQLDWWVGLYYGEGGRSVAMRTWIGMNPSRPERAGP